MPLETVGIPLSREPLYEAGAILLATMAYPEDETRRARFHCAFCRETIRAMAEDSNFAWALQPIRPIYFMNDDKVSREDYEFGFDRLAERKIAANSTYSLFRGAIKGSPARTIKAFGSEYKNTPGHRHFLTRLWQGYQDPTPSQIKNITPEFEAPSRPVIHAAFAIYRMQMVLRDMGRAKGDDADTEALRIIVHERDALRAVVMVAEECRQIAPSIKDLRVTEADLIQFVAI